jgi:ElaB/YqjD/DUF883 family membrane-anchored ribosome-binding protein
MGNKSHASAIQETVQEQSERLVEEVRELGSRAVEATGDALHDARRRGRRSVRRGRERLRHGAEDVEDYVSDHPLQSVGVACGLGLLVGMFLRR